MHCQENLQSIRWIDNRGWKAVHYLSGRKAGWQWYEKKVFSMKSTQGILAGDVRVWWHGFRHASSSHTWENNPAMPQKSLQLLLILSLQSAATLALWTGDFILVLSALWQHHIFLCLLKSAVLKSDRIRRRIEPDRIRKRVEGIEIHYNKWH